MKTRGAAGSFQYDQLELSGEAAAAARRMEARAAEPASAAMFEALVAPLLASGPRRILELGCGSGALARRVAAAVPDARVVASDKSATMIAVATELAAAAGLGNLTCLCCDAGDASTWVAGDEPLDLVLSSVMVPYLAGSEVEHLLANVCWRLSPGGVVAFVEQDLQTDSLYLPDGELRARVYAKDGRVTLPHTGLGLYSLLAGAELEPLPRQSFLWTETRYGPYLRDLLGHIADDALATGRIDAAERRRWDEELERIAGEGRFYYGLVYHRVCGRRV